MATSFVSLMDSEKPASANVRCEHTFKVLLIGDSGVGKSSMLLRYTEAVFSDQAVSNIGVVRLALPQIACVLETNKLFFFPFFFINFFPCLERFTTPRN